ncbi:RNA polymerase sigma factor [Sorangium sp. So ce136]|uniref:sigma-70 family RNA polymerase sigma factor n=1 Tax=Sorangium sp. So ce136 TaxID=3133284 RepID=UPI003F094C6C
MDECSIRSRSPLADPDLRRTLTDFVRRRMSGADVEDVVQTVLCEALTAKACPEEPAEFRCWLLGIARHKVARHLRRSARESVAELPDVPVAPPPIEARELARWAERQAAASTRDAEQTLDWMAREGEGEKLESIAAAEHVPAARVRQRVSRMRRWMRERWLAELAAVAALSLLALLVARLLRRPKEEIAFRPEPVPSRLEVPSSAPIDSLSPGSPDQQKMPEQRAPARTPVAPSPTSQVVPAPKPRQTPASRSRAQQEVTPLDTARQLRAQALWACEVGYFQPCLTQLDEAARLDPAGDRAPEVQGARERTHEALGVQGGSSDPRPTPAPKAAPEAATPRSLAPNGSPLPGSLDQQKMPEQKAPARTHVAPGPTSNVIPAPTPTLTPASIPPARPAARSVAPESSRK